MKALLFHLPILQVIVPLLMALIISLIGNRHIARTIMILASALMLTITFALLLQTKQYGAISYALGDWIAPWGIEYRVDALTVFVLLTINIISFIASIYCLGRNDSNLNPNTRPTFYAIWLLFIAGLNGMVVTNDAFNLFVFLEISSLAGYALIACGRYGKALLAAYRYLILGSIGATLFLLSIGLLYMQTGTLNISDIARIIAYEGTNYVTLIALAFFLIGIGIKCALFPLHDWLPNAYSYAPNSVTVLMSGTATKVGLYVMLRFLYGLFGADFSIDQIPLDIILIVCSIAGMLIAPIIALRESNLKRIFGWSSIAQISFITMAIGLGTHAGNSAAILYLFNHSIVKAAVFISVGMIIARTTTGRVKYLGGIAHKHKLASYTLLFGGLGLIGLPGTVGFVSKWVLVSAVLESGWWWLTIPILLGSVGSVAYIWRLVEILWTKPTQDDFHETVSLPPHIVEWLPLLILISLSVWFGLNATWIEQMAQFAASALTR